MPLFAYHLHLITIPVNQFWTPAIKAANTQPWIRGRKKISDFNMIILFVFSGRLYGFGYDYDQIILVFYEK